MPKLTIASVDRKIAALQKIRSKLVLAETSKTQKKAAKVKALMKKLGITAADVIGGAGKRKGAVGRPPKAATGAARKGKRSGAARYKNAETGETWGGMGRPPKWITLAEKAGKKREDFKVK